MEVGRLRVTCKNWVGEIDDPQKTDLHLRQIEANNRIGLNYANSECLQANLMSRCHR